MESWQKMEKKRLFVLNPTINELLVSKSIFTFKHLNNYVCSIQFFFQSSTPTIDTMTLYIVLNLRFLKNIYNFLVFHIKYSFFLNRWWIPSSNWPLYSLYIIWLMLNFIENFRYFVWKAFVLRKMCGKILSINISLRKSMLKPLNASHEFFCNNQKSFSSGTSISSLLPSFLFPLSAGIFLSN